MTLQDSILRQYMEIFRYPTLKWMARDTGIQVTRIFRLFNGLEMKVVEYQILSRKIQEKLGFQGTLRGLAEECTLKLSARTIKELENALKRKLRLWALNGDRDEVAAVSENLRA